MADYGAQDMAQTLARVLMRRPGPSLSKADPAAWHNGPGFDAESAATQYEQFAGLVARSGAEILWIEDRGDGLADAMFTCDPSLVTREGAVLLRMGKAAREREVALHEAAYKKAGIPILGRIKAPGTVEGGDCFWLDAQTLIVGRGFRTNEEGIVQLADILAPLSIDVLSYDLPSWKGESACLHLLSLISPLTRDTALVHSPLLPAALYQLLEEWGLALVEAPEDEFRASQGLSLNVLPTSPGAVIMIDGYPKTKAALEAAGCTVSTFAADALCIACEGGPTCLVRPVLREGL